MSAETLTPRPWTEAETARLRLDYERYQGRLYMLAGEMQRTVPFLCRKARVLGLTNSRRSKPWLVVPEAVLVDFARQHDTLSDAELAGRFGLTVSGVEKWRVRLGLRKSQKMKWKRRAHPRGFSGRKHTAASLAKIAAKSRAAWANPDSGLHSESVSQDKSDRMAQLRAEGRVRVGYSRGRAGRRADLDNRYFRSAWEANYARYLNFLMARGLVIAWQYEPDTFWFDAIKRGTRSYTPDFRILAPGQPVYYVEVKGWMDPKSITRLRRMAKYHPDIVIELVAARQYRELANKLARLIPGWER